MVLEGRGSEEEKKGGEWRKKDGREEERRGKMSLFLQDKSETLLQRYDSLNIFIHVQGQKAKFMFRLKYILYRKLKYL